MKNHIGIFAVTVTAVLSLPGLIIGAPRFVPSAGDGTGPRTLSPEELAIYVQSENLESAGTASMSAAQFSAAEVDARQALSLEPGSELGEEILASALYAQGKDQEALQEYQALASMGPNPPRVWLPYALLLLKNGQWPEALAAYRQALPLLPDGDLIRTNSDFSADTPQPLGLATAIHISMGLTMDGGDFHGTYQARSEQALAHFQQAVALEPDNALANYYYGYGLQKMGRQAQAQAAFTKAIKIGHGGVKVAARKALAKIKQPA